MKNHPPTFAIACSLVCGVNLMSPFAVFGGDSRPSPPDSASSSRSALSLRWENDTIAGQDENYSNGISLALTRSGQSWLGGIWNLFGADGDRYLHGYDFGQIIVTPADINRTVPDPNDRPYSGLLYFAASTHLIRENRFHGLKFITGVVGPYSFAEETQREVHRLGGSAIPQGWDYQLETEPIFNMVYEHRRRYDLFQTESGFGFQVIPMAGAMLGNVLIQGQAGAQLRLGYNLPDDFGTTLMRGLGNLPFPREDEDAPNQRNFGAYLFAGGGANLVARNLALDGNTFRDSPSVDKRPFFPGAEFGASVVTRRFQATFSYVIWGKEFYGQQRHSEFGAVTVSYFF
ncbi:MAG: lipid A deacylase LpxR family protein [Verrucomicrobiota bacterium]|mgnify:CR=1 FL=1